MSILFISLRNSRRECYWTPLYVFGFKLEEKNASGFIPAAKELAEKERGWEGEGGTRVKEVGRVGGDVLV